jgi:hypothetical protein
LSQFVSFPDGSRFAFPVIVQVTRTGGTALQSGAALSIGVAQRTTNTVQITSNGEGAATVEWNGRPPRSFTGVEATLVQAGAARQDLVTFHLTNPRTGGTAIAAGQIVTTPTASARTLARSAHSLRSQSARTSGIAVQTGSVLTITVSSPKIDVVEISSWNFGRLVRAEWNGGAVRSFSGVNTIIVDIRNDTKDLVGLDVATGKAP